MIAAIIQARMASTRLPGKVLEKVLGKTFLEHLILRLGRSRLLDEIIVATTTKKIDNLITRLAEKLGIPYFRGSEEDVLERYYQAARAFDVDHIVRITGDCPLIDPAVIDKVLSHYLKSGGSYDYVSNVHPCTFPDGMDVEVFSWKALEEAWRNARLPSEREHVTPYIWKRPKTFRLGNVSGPGHLPQLRLTLDNQEDLVLIRTVFRYLYPRNHYFTLADIIALFRKKPDLGFINRGVIRNEGFLKSLEQDKLFLKRRRFINR